MSVTVDLLITQFLDRGGANLESRFRSLSREANKFGEAQGRAITRSATVGSAGVAGLIATSKLISAALEKAGEAQATKTGFTTLLGDAKKADELFNKLQKFALDTPFDDASTKRLSSFLLATGTQADQVIDRMHAMGNAVAAAGKGDAELKGVVMAMSALGNSTVASRQQIKRLEIRGIQANKILQQELGLSADQVQNLGAQMIKGSVVAEALYRGMEKVGGGKAMENMVKTLPGQLATLNDAKNQLLTAIGEPLIGDATKFVHLLAEGASYLKDMAHAHPQVTKGLVYGAGLASGAAAISGGINAFKLASLAKKALTKATSDDNRAELAKSATAVKEAGAIGKTEDAALNAAGAKKKLMTATERAAEANRKSAAQAIEKAAEKEAAKDAAKEGEKEVIKAGGKLANLRTLLGKQAFNVNEGGLLERAGAQTGARSFGQVGAGAAAGALAGYSVYDSLSNQNNQAALRAAGININDNGAKIGGAVTGAIVGALVIAAPEFAVPIIAAIATIKGAGVLADKYINEPQEKKAEAGTGADNKEIYGSNMSKLLADAQKNRDNKAQSQIYEQMSQKAYASGDIESGKNFHEQSKIQADIDAKSRTYGTSQYWAKAMAPQQADPRIKAEFDAAMRRASPSPESLVNIDALGPYGIYGDPRQNGATQISAQPQGRRVGNQFEISFGTIRFDDPAGDQARKQSQQTIRNAYA